MFHASRFFLSSFPEGRGEKQIRSRGASSAPEFCQATKQVKAKRPNLRRVRNDSFRLASGNKGKRSAERRIVLPIAAISAAARCLPTTRPPFGAHARGTRHRLLPRWLSSRTGFPAAAAKRAFLPLRQPKRKPMPRLSTLRADRSLCRSTGDPKPPGSGRQNPRAGTAPRHRCYGMPSGTAPCTKRGNLAYNRNGD
jgi:hypothetical protein